MTSILFGFEVETYQTAQGKGILEGDPGHIYCYLEVIFLSEEKLIDLLSRGGKTLDQVVQEGIIYGNKSPKGLGIRRFLKER